MAKLRQFIIPLFIFLCALALRGYKAQVHHPFWVDEFSTAFQANLIRDYGLNVFSQTEYYVEYHNFLPHFLVAGAFQLLGESTFAARLPFILIGSLVPVMIWYLVAKVFRNQVAALPAAMFATFSYFEITWSRQARGYVLQQLLFLIVIAAYVSFFNGKTKKSQFMSAVILLTAIVAGVLTHMSFLLIVAVLILHAGWFYRSEIFQRVTSQKLIGVFSAVASLVLLYVSFPPISRFATFLLAGNIPNNLAYYHSFLWREYGVLMLLTVIGAVYSYLKDRKVTTLLALCVINYILFFSFVFEPKVTRYLLPIFPVFFIFAGYGLEFLVNSTLAVTKHSRYIARFCFVIPAVLSMLIILNGDKFSVKPKAFYSVNHDFREIALIDYDQVYDVIKTKGELEKGETAVIDTWSDRRDWYLGAEYPAKYMFRWTESDELLKQTQYITTPNGEKMSTLRKDEGLVSSVEDLLRLIAKHPKGFIWIDDTSLPADVRDFAAEQLHKELMLDHYTFDDNPYSLWPGTLYSWGTTP